MKLIAFSVIAVAATACHADSKPLGVHETIQNIHKLNGQTVRVAGYLGTCGGYDCGLYENKAEWEQFRDYLATLKATHKLPPGELPDWLGIGGSSKFDAQAQPFANGYVLITGKVSDSCRDVQLRQGCVDRAPELEPTAINRWTEPQPNS